LFLHRPFSLRLASFSLSLRVSCSFLVKARHALSEGDLVQASEKGWGAAAQAVKAVAESRGWSHQSHRDLFQAVGRLTTETGDGGIGDLFHAASSLHVNFYENWMPIELVGGGLERVEEFVARLEGLAP
jgi:hypothetical protein